MRIARREGVVSDKGEKRAEFFKVRFRFRARTVLGLWGGWVDNCSHEGHEGSTKVARPTLRQHRGKGWATRHVSIDAQPIGAAHALQGSLEDVLRFRGAKQLPAPIAAEGDEMARSGLLIAFQSPRHGESLAHCPTQAKTGLEWATGLSDSAFAQGHGRTGGKRLFGGPLRAIIQCEFYCSKHGKCHLHSRPGGSCLPVSSGRRHCWLTLRAEENEAAHYRIDHHQRCRLERS